LVFDFGGGTLDVAIVKMEGDLEDAGKFCHVMGKAGLDLGGTRIDEWLFQEIYERQGKELSEDDWNIVSRSLLTACETLKERLSFEEEAEVSVFNPFTGGSLAVSFTRNDFEGLLDKHDAFSKIDKTIRRALKMAEQKGFAEEDIKSVLMVGGCSNIPAMQKMLKRIFGAEKVKLTRPMDAVARGAARFAAGMAFKDYIQHDYAIRYVNPINGLYEYRPIVRRGTQYPTLEPTAVLTIKASFDGQNQLGIPIFEIGHDSWSVADMRNEIFLDYAGKPHTKNMLEKEITKRNFFWINKKNPTFLWVDSPAKKSEPYFELQFSIDSNRRLLITALNVKNGKTMLENYPVANLI
jgi:molecular chaperone DnaK